MKYCYNCGKKFKKDGLRTHEGVFCSKDCADGIVLPQHCVENQPLPLPEYEVKFIAQEPTTTTVTQTAPPVKEEITLFDHYAAAAIAALILRDKFMVDNYELHVKNGMRIASMAIEERKKYIK